MDAPHKRLEQIKEHLEICSDHEDDERWVVAELEAAWKKIEGFEREVRQLQRDNVERAKPGDDSNG